MNHAASGQERLEAYLADTCTLGAYHIYRCELYSIPYISQTNRSNSCSIDL